MDFSPYPYPTDTLISDAAGSLPTGDGLAGWLRPYLAIDNPWVCGLLIVTLVVTMLSTTIGQRTLSLQLTALTSPEGSRKGNDAVRMQNVASAHIMHAVCTVACAACLAVAFTLETPATATALAASTAYWLLFFVLKRALAGYVNWTFFDTQARQRWAATYRLSMSVNAIVWTVCVMLAACNRFGNPTMLFIAVLGLLPGTATLVYGAVRLFFGKMQGCLHFLLYLCTLELLPPLGAALLHIALARELMPGVTF